MSQTTAVEILSTGTINAGLEILRRNGQDPRQADAGLLSEAFKTTIKGNLDRILSEWGEATDANLNDGWLRQMMNAQCFELANEALKDAGLI